MFFLVFLGIIGGTLDNRISEALFCLFFNYGLYLFRLYFSGVFRSNIGGTPDKRIGGRKQVINFTHFDNIRDT